MREEPKYYKSKFYNQDKDILNKKAPYSLKKEFFIYHEKIKYINKKGKKIMIVR